MNETQVDRILELMEKVVEQSKQVVVQNALLFKYIERRDEEIQDFLLKRDGRIIQRNGALEQAEKDLKFDLKKAAHAEVLNAIAAYGNTITDDVLRKISLRSWRELLEDIADRVYAEKKKAAPEEPQAAAEEE